MLVFCQCGSDRVDHRELEHDARSRLHCYTCGREAWLDGFTLGEFDPAKLFSTALIDQARKHRKRSPEETNRPPAEGATWMTLICSSMT
jgi:hypothetical protein